MNYWMSYEWRRIRGERPAYPEPNSESFPAAAASVDVGEWDRRRRDLAGFLVQYAELAKSPALELQPEIESAQTGDKTVAGTIEAVLWQMVAHNSYHVGQIGLIRRALGVWPPRAGKDRW
jgi:uncharacterized damage-inducible protein DinB